MKATKRGSSWRVRVYDYTDAEGKEHTRSFTARTRREAEQLAADFVRQRQSRTVSYDCSVYDAVKNYIDLKEAVFSPATVRSYHCVLRHQIGDHPIAAVPLPRLNTQTAQAWVSELVQTGASPKTVKNAYALFTASVSFFLPDLRLRVKLPQAKPLKLYTPSSEDVQTLLRAAEKDPLLKRSIMLAAFGPLRRGEISALTAEDIDFENGTVSVNKAYVRREDGTHALKPPKTEGSVRTVSMPRFVIDELPRTGRTVELWPEVISHRFVRLLDTLDLPRFRFHDLRHYSASIMVALNIDLSTIQQRGGWENLSTVEKHYVRPILQERQRSDRLLMDYFDSIATS